MVHFPVLDGKNVRLINIPDHPTKPVQDEHV